MDGKMSYFGQFVGANLQQIISERNGGYPAPSIMVHHLSGHAKLCLGPVPYSHSEYLFSLVLLCDGNLRNDVSGSFYQTGSILSRLSQLAVLPASAKLSKICKIAIFDIILRFS